MRDVLEVVAHDIDLARRLLDSHGPAGVESARACRESAMLRLGPPASTSDLPADAWRAAARCRATLSSHLIAADELEAAGAPRDTVVRVLRQGTEAARV